jgi:hypothetical protein
MDASAGAGGAWTASDFLCIRGTRLPWRELVDPRLFDAGHRELLRQSLQTAQPYEHLVVDGWFHPDLLRLAREEFDLYPFDDHRDLDRAYENTVRSPRYPVLGPATATYFAIVNAGWFVALMSELTGVPQLIPDPTLHNAGLHESRRGGKFAIHRDFERSECTGLYNEMVLLTYLNEGWDPAWNGALELWDAERAHCVRKVEPELGRSIVMRNGATHFHGHPTPLATPEQQVRRSLASYYYGQGSGPVRRQSTASVYLKQHQFDRFKQVARQVTPPIVWTQLKRLLA